MINVRIDYVRVCMIEYLHESYTVIVVFKT